MDKLTQREILTALLEGKKIRRVDWGTDVYIYLKNDLIVNQDGYQNQSILVTSHWEIYTPTVTFFEALEAMKEGKNIKMINKRWSVSFNSNGVTITSNLTNFVVNREFIYARWQILEGDNK